MQILRAAQGRNQSLLRFAVVSAAAVLLLGGTGALTASEKRPARPAAIHPERRSAASPAEGQLVSVNPPPLLWPRVSGKEVRYRVRLSQDRRFPPNKTIAEDRLRWAMFNPHQTLATGTWYWQYAASRKRAGKPKWSKVFRFRVGPSARVFPTPPADQMLAACPREHPRILAASDDLQALRNRLKGSARWSRFVGRNAIASYGLRNQLKGSVQWARFVGRNAIASYRLRNQLKGSVQWARFVGRNAIASSGQRNQPKGSAQWARTIKAADRCVGRPPPSLSKAQPAEKGRSPYESRNFAKWASKAYAGKLRESIRSLVQSYLVTREERYGRSAVQWGLFVARLDPDGATSPRVSDFADGSCMEAMALVYDACYDLLSEEQKAALRQAMTTRANRLFGRCMNNLETRVFSAHLWQHILMQATDVAVALLGEVPEAETWVTYVYELWIARFPLLGGDDGGWANGVNYFGTNFRTLLEMPALFGRLTGVDFLDHPWYRSAAYYQIYCWPPGSASDGFGDGGERESPPPRSRGEFVMALAQKFRDPYALWYARQVLGRQSETEPAGSSAALPPAKPPRDLPQARAFRDIGVVSMHTDLAHAARDLMIGFRSSPYGSHNHMHCDQNSFNILFGGARLFANSGYYIAYGDDHFKGWYTQTRGHNSVLIDGRGQQRGASGYGWIARFLHGRQISYCLGDASAAYGDAGLNTFRRHLVFLRPWTIVVYDELEADHPARWSWLLHSKDRIIAAGQRLAAAAKTARSQVDLLGSSSLNISIDDRFDPPAVNWRKRRSGGRVLEYPNQWHATVTPASRSRKMRVLAIIQVRPSGEGSGFAEPMAERQGSVRLGRWRIEAELEVSRPASLLIQRVDGQAALAADRPSVTVGSKCYDLSGSAALLVETEPAVVRRCREELPPATR